MASKKVYQLALENTDLIIEGLKEKGYTIVTPLRKRNERTAIVHFNTNSIKTTKVLYEKLKENKVLVTLQNENIRVSPNFFNTKEEIRVFLSFV